MKVAKWIMRAIVVLVVGVMLTAVIISAGLGRQARMTMKEEKKAKAKSSYTEKEMTITEKFRDINIQVADDMDRMDERIVLVATTNLYKHFDKALIRRFDSVIDFNRYSQSDLMDISEEYLNKFLTKFNLAKKDIRLFRKIMLLLSPLPYPGDLKNLIKTAVAFSNPDDELDYFRRLYYAITSEKPEDIKKLQEQRFTIREIEILSKIPKSSVARELKEMSEDE